MTAVQTKRGRPEAPDEPGLSLEDLERMRLAQWGEMREIAITYLRRFGKGVAGGALDLPWVDPDWDSDPETWPSPAKLLWVLCMATDALDVASSLRHMRGWLGFCEGCHPGEPRPKEIRASMTCPLHQVPATGVQSIAKSLWPGVGQ